MRIPQWVKPAVWGAVVGAVAIMIVGFAWWGWVLGSTAERMAKEREEQAITALLTPLCVERFLNQPDAEVKLAEFRQTSSWQRPRFIEEGGWATPPGDQRPHSRVASLCADMLMKKNSA